MEPIKNFFNCSFDEWEQSVLLNSLAQLRVLHGLFPFREKNVTSSVIFFAGGGTNGPFTNYSAYCAAKILLIKICELLDDENEDVNPYIIGPGWVRTKMHNQTINNPLESGKNYQRTIDFLSSDIQGTSYDDIYNCIKWCNSQGKSVAGGRNFSVVHDRWSSDGDLLVETLRNDINKYKLRRFKNDE
jgi:NADP-dependent 3-hydroxy acid dehydrogenase YdfG